MSDNQRINRVVTRTGDSGETGLADGSRLAKDAPVIEAMGDVDELNAVLGVLRHKLGDSYESLLESVQQALFEIGAELAIPGSVRLDEEQVLHLEHAIAEFNAALPPLKEFVLPGGTDAAGWCHFCRTVARRAERRLVTVMQSRPLNPQSLRYLNRLSDALFVFARHLNSTAGRGEPQWRPQR